MTDLQPQSVTSKYWCRKDFQFRKAAETHHSEPPQVRGWLEGGAVGLDVEVKLCRARGSAEQADGGGLWVPIARWMAQTVHRE